MAIDLTPEQRQLGQENFARVADGMTRRRFLKGAAAAGGAMAIGVPAMYFGYQTVGGKPVKAALIGGGDEGGVLVGEHNPDFIKFIAICDIRPFNQKRIIEGDPKVALRKGFRKMYGNSEADSLAKSHMYSDFREMLKNEPDIEAVVIALPLHLHAPVAMECMKIGKERGKPIHVLCEKLMARTVGDCKQMIKTAKDTGSILSIGHQRHYSLLYANARDILEGNVLGDIKHIRALWHRNFSWPYAPEKTPWPAPWVKEDMELAEEFPPPVLRDGWYPAILKKDYEALKDPEKLRKYDFKSIQELVRWRLFDRTGGGLMAELGSHQLDACSIFLGKVHPLAVTAIGEQSFFDRMGKGHRNPREADDHVFATFEFPGKNHPQGPNQGSDKDDVVVVTYSSISTNGFEQYGECVMGTRGTMIVEAEQKVFLYTERDPGKKAGDPKATAVTVTTADGKKPALESGGTWGPAASATAGSGAGPAGSSAGPVSRGYREEMEDFAYCVRTWDPKIGYAKDGAGKYQQRLPRCHGEVAMADAIIALTSNLAMRNRKEPRIEFDHKWFDAAEMDAVPEKKHSA
jgi:predicted dehydrogenase